MRVAEQFSALDVIWKRHWIIFEEYFRYTCFCVRAGYRLNCIVNNSHLYISNILHFPRKISCVGLYIQLITSNGIFKSKKKEKNECFSSVSSSINCNIVFMHIPTASVHNVFIIVSSVCNLKREIGSCTVVFPLNKNCIKCSW